MHMNLHAYEYEFMCQLGAGSTIFGPLWGGRLNVLDQTWKGLRMFMHLAGLFVSPHPIINELSLNNYKWILQR